MLLDYLLDATGSLDTEPLQYQMISGSGYDWFYDPVSRAMAEVARGTEVVQLSEESDYKGRILVRAPYKFLLIPEEEIIDIGFN